MDLLSKNLFCTVLCAFLFVSPALAEVPCDEGYVYTCNEYGICGCTLKPGGVPHIKVLDGESSASRGEDLLIVNNGDGSDFLEGQDGDDLLIVNNGDGSDFLEAEEHLLGLGFALEMDEEQILELARMLGVSESEVIRLLELNRR